MSEIGTDGVGFVTSDENLRYRRRTFVPVVENGVLVGVSSRRRVSSALSMYTPALDASGNLRMSPPLGSMAHIEGRVEAMMEASVDTLVVDTAHGHQEKMIEALRRVKAMNPGAPVGRRKRRDRSGGRGTG